MESVNDVPPATRRILRAPVVGMLLVGVLASCRPERMADPLSVLPPRCGEWTAPGADGCLSVREKGKEYEFRYEQAGGTVATVIERQSAGELLTEVKLNSVTTWVRRAGHDAGGAWRESEVVEFEYPLGSCCAKSATAGPLRAIQSRRRRAG